MRLVTVLTLLLAACAFDPRVENVGRARVCGDIPADELRGSSVQSVSGGSGEYLIGTFTGQGDGDPFVARIVDDQVAWCNIYSTTEYDESGRLIKLGGDGDPRVVFHTTNSGTELEAHDAAFQATPGSGDGKVISYVARLSSSTGDVLVATFLRATRESGLANDLLVTSLAVDGTGNVSVAGDSWRAPPPYTEQQCNFVSPTEWSATLSADLGELITFSAVGCTN